MLVNLQIYLNSKLSVYVLDCYGSLLAQYLNFSLRREANNWDLKIQTTKAAVLVSMHRRCPSDLNWVKHLVKDLLLDHFQIYPAMDHYPFRYFKVVIKLVM